MAPPVGEPVSRPTVGEPGFVSPTHTRHQGPWTARVADSGGVAFRPGEVLVNTGSLRRWQERFPDEVLPLPDYPEEILGGRYRRYQGVDDPVGTVRKLIEMGLEAQVNHVLFGHASPGDLPANPFYANPFYANPFYANPFYANPFYANPFYANPFYANAPGSGPGAAAGPRQSSARPGRAFQRERLASPDPGESPRIVILDTGYDTSLPLTRPQVLSGHFVDEPDGDTDTYLDPVAGHGTFIAGIIESLVPGCWLDVRDVMNPYGDVVESDVVDALDALADEVEPGERPAFVNLSFGGYSTTGMNALAGAITRLHHLGTVVVASAGNDGSPRPMYPAALPHVLAVGALDHAKYPAPFTNFGPWVRACALGVEVVSTFFEFDGAHPARAGGDIDNFAGWAVWSGTSFAAPRVVAELAAWMVDHGGSPHDAVREVIDQGEERIPLLGTVIGY